MNKLLLAILGVVLIIVSLTIGSRESASQSTDAGRCYACRKPPQYNPANYCCTSRDPYGDWPLFTGAESCTSSGMNPDGSCKMCCLYGCCVFVWP